MLVAVILLSPGFSYSSVFSNHLAFADEDDPNENDKSDVCGTDHNQVEPIAETTIFPV